MPRIRIHDCRHCVATMLLESRVLLRVVQELLRHRSLVVTGDLYSHVRPAFTRQAADALVVHLGAARRNVTRNSTESEQG